jgi:hypothetical protein
MGKLMERLKLDYSSQAEKTEMSLSRKIYHVTRARLALNNQLIDRPDYMEMLLIKKNK